MDAIKVFLSPERRPTPHGKYWGMDLYEHDYCCQIADLMVPMLEGAGFVPMIAERAMGIADRVLVAKAWGADYYLPIHTNASTNGESEGKAQGALVLCRDDTQSKLAAQAIFDRLNALHPSKRGIQTSNFLEIRETDCVVAYPEIAFHDNAEDARFLAENRQALAQALVAGICDYYRTEPVTHTEQDYRELFSDFDALKTRIKRAIEILENGNGFEY